MKLTAPGITSGIPNSYNCCLEPSQLEIEGIAVACTLTTMENGLTVVRLMNPTDSPIILQLGMHIGQFTPVSDDDIVSD